MPVVLNSRSEVARAIRPPEPISVALVVAALAWSSEVLARAIESAGGEATQPRRKPPPRIDRIQEVVAELADLHLTEMHSLRRARSVAWPRQVAMALARDLTPRSLPEIGRAFGGRDHTTVMHAVRQVAKRLAEGEPATVDLYDAAKARLG